MPERFTKRQPSDSSSGGEPAQPPRSKSSRGMFGRIALGASRRSLAEVFAVDPSPRPTFRRQSTGGSARSVSSTAGASMRTNRGNSNRRGDAQQAQHQRHALFGDREVDGAGGGGRGSATAAGRAGGGLSGAHTAVTEARDLAIERGEKLESMVDKSRELEDSAMAFGDMAKQLRRQQEDEACSIS